MSWKLRISQDAERDIEQVLTTTYDKFGEHKYAEYRGLVALTLQELGSDPTNARTKTRPEIHPQARTVHLARKGKAARHFILYRIVDESIVEIGRLLYDGMDLAQHLPEQYAQ